MPEDIYLPYMVTPGGQHRGVLCREETPIKCILKEWIWREGVEAASYTRQGCPISHVPYLASRAPPGSHPTRTDPHKP